MISGGLATVFVSDMDRAIRFYTETLGLKLEQRFGDHWASVKTGGLTIGLHPASETSTAGRKGSITIGLNLNEPIEGVVDRLKRQGVKFTRGIVEDGFSRAAHFEDPDGNELYIIELAAEWSKYAPSDAGVEVG
jgi:predicted enzyme related to lactoylglutathione lyase